MTSSVYNNAVTPDEDIRVTPVSNRDARRLASQPYMLDEGLRVGNFAGSAVPPPIQSVSSIQVHRP